MTDKTEPASPDAAKRPHATLDLKATEVKGTTVAAPPPATSSSNEKVAESKASPNKPADAKSGDAETSAKTSAPPPPAVRSTSRVFAHLLSGVAGGLLALFGADQVAPMLGLKTPGAAMHDSALDLQKRMTALEAAAKASASKEIGRAHV